PRLCAVIVFKAAIVARIALAGCVGSAVTDGGAAHAVVLCAAGGRIGRQVVIVVGNTGNIAYGNALFIALHVKGVVGAGAVEVGVKVSRGNLHLGHGLDLDGNALIDADIVVALFPGGHGGAGVG